MPIFNSWQVTSAWCEEGKSTNGQPGRHSLADPDKQTEQLPPLKSHVQSYLIQTSTAITVSPHRQSEYVISSIFLRADSLTIVEEPLLFWQPTSCHWGSVWVFPASQTSLCTHWCHYVPLPSLSLHMFLVPVSQKAHLSLRRTVRLEEDLKTLFSSNLPC